MSVPVAETEALREVDALTTTPTDAFVALGVTPPRTLLLSGPPGVGKTRAVVTVAQRRGFTLHTLDPGPHVVQRMKRAFQQTSLSESRSSDLIFIDELDAICPASTWSDSSKAATGLATTLLTSLLDDLRRQCRRNVFVVAATNRADGVDPTLRRAGRFDRNVALRPPDLKTRTTMIQSLLPASLQDVQGLAKELAQSCGGFVVADMVGALERAQSECEGEQPSAEHVRKVFTNTTASMLRTGLAPRLERTEWDSIGGLDETKRRLQRSVEWPVRYAETFRRLGLRRTRGILLHGPPGCAKTTLVRAMATMSGMPLLRLTASDVYSCYVGDSERVIRETFSLARMCAPCVVFLDEVEALVGRRGYAQAVGDAVQRRVLGTLLTEMDGVVSLDDVVVVGATNRVELVDDALLRPGRFDDVLQVGLPDRAGRTEILQTLCRRMGLADADDEAARLAGQTDGWSGAQLRRLCDDAAMSAMRRRGTDVSGVSLTVRPDDFRVLKPTR